MEKPWASTQHRKGDAETAKAELHIVTGVLIAEWRQRPGYTEVIEYDRRTDDERVRFRTLRDRVIARLTEVDRPDVAEIVDTNLFGASLQPGLPQDVVDDMSEMLLLSVPIAGFIAPPGSPA